MSRIRKLSNLTVVIAASLLIVGLGLYDLTKDRLPSDSFLTALDGRKIYSWIAVSPPSTLKGVTPRDEPRFAANSGVGQIGDLWALTGKPGEWEVTSWSLSERKMLTRDSEDGTTLLARTPIEYPDEIGEFDVSPWAKTANNLMIFDPVGKRLRVRRLPMDPLNKPGRAVDAGLTPPLPPLAQDNRRTLSMAEHSGPLPDLYVMDSRPDLRWEISVYSGESGFSEKLDSWLTARVVSGKLRPDQWQLDMVESPSGGDPDLSMLTRGIKSGSNHTELHVLTAESGFRKFPTRIPMDLNGKLGPEHQLLVLPRFVDEDDEVFGTILHIFPRDGKMKIAWLPFKD